MLGYLGLKPLDVGVDVVDTSLAENVNFTLCPAE